MALRSSAERMRVHNVFLVTLRVRKPLPGGQLLRQEIVCAVDRGAMVEMVGSKFPADALVGAVALGDLEATAKKIRAVLGGHDRSLSITVAPELMP